ncbi:carbohydrate binding domain-containing protein [Paenibacillus sp. HW567]|uniref:carbohydrate binding domain-containing protein n=1 Tax=Paenibacillus sp. HW567 TaxID=1034769 RepID=UPI0003817E20|nr:carbohydrate binding domain-containing protein [Paenibacillus sp. HW567]
MLRKLASLFICSIIIFVLAIPVVRAKSGTTYIYSKNGQLVELTNSNGSFELKYDKNGNLVSKSTADNLLSNSGFENYSGSENTADGWDKYMAPGVRGAYEILTAEAVEGRQAQKLTVTSFPNAGDGANVSQVMLIKGNESYNVKGMLKLANMKNAKFSVIVFFYDANNQLIGGQTPVEYTQNIADWATFSGNVTSPANAASARVHLHLSATASNAQGTVYLDGVTATLQKDSNLVFNGGFESDKRHDGGADGWDKYMAPEVSGAYEIITGAAVEGRQAQKLAVTSFPNAGDGANVSQVMLIKDNESYNVKGMLKLANMKNAKFSVIVFFYDANNQLIGGQTPVEYTQNIADWATFSGNVTSPANAVSARIHLHLSATASNAQGTVYLDNISVKSF